MKNLEKIKITAMLLFVTIIIFASFFGVYKKEDFRAVNIIKKYNLGMQFTDSILLKGTVNLDEKKVIYDNNGNIIEDDGETQYTEENGYTIKTEKINSEDVLNENNYKLTKKILKNRLKGLGIGEYLLDINNETGEISIKLQENDKAHEVEQYLEQTGKFSIIDKETKEILLDNSDVKLVKVMYGASQADVTSTTIYLQIDFNKKGAKKLEEISQVYVAEETEEHNHNEEGHDHEHDHDEEPNAKYVSVVLDGQTYSSTYFGEKMSTGVLYVPITQATDTETITKYVAELNNVATIINNGTMPIEYTFTEEVVKSNITKDMIIIGILVPSTLLLVACIVLIFKFKAKGLVATFVQMGYIALLLLVVRYVNVIITLEGAIGIVLSVILNYILTYIMLSNLKNKEKIEWKSIGKFALVTIPVYLIAIILTFNPLTKLSSLGMTMVWGSFFLYIYNLSITRAILKIMK